MLTPESNYYAPLDQEGAAEVVRDTRKPDDEMVDSWPIHYSYMIRKDFLAYRAQESDKWSFKWDPAWRRWIPEAPPLWFKRDFVPNGGWKDPNRFVVKTDLETLLDEMKELFDFSVDANCIATGVKKTTFVAQGTVVPEQDSSKEEKKSEEEEDYIFPLPVTTDNCIRVPKDAFETFLRSFSLSPYRAGVQLIKVVMADLPDVPLRDLEWFKANQCVPPNVDPDCKAYKLDDWNYAHVAGTNKPSPNFAATMKKVVQSSFMVLRADQNAPPEFRSRLAKKLAYQDVTYNPYFIYATNMNDEEQFEADEESEYFSQLYWLRKRIGLNGDYGFRSNVEFVAEGARPSRPDESDPLADVDLDELPVGTSVREWISNSLTRIWNAITSMFGYVTSSYTSVLDKVKDLLSRSLVKLIDYGERFKELATASFKMIVSHISVIMGVLFLAGAGILSWVIARMVLKRYQRPNAYVAEAEVSPIAVLSATTAGLFGLSTNQESKTLAKMRYIAGLMAGGTVVANVGAFAFSLMPIVLQDALCWKFGSTDYKHKYEVNTWKSRANALLQYSMSPRVVSSPFYHSQIEIALRDGQEILDSLTGLRDAGLRSVTVNTVLRLQKIRTQINQYTDENKKRAEPFVMHMFGAPGVGKTMYAEQFMKRIGLDTFYSNNKSDQFMSGYQDQDVMLIDEFLVGPAESQAVMAEEFLSLASSASYHLNQATIDNPLLGIKGQTFKSKAIVTLNNTGYPRVAGYDDQALQRRRDCVVEVAIHPDYLKYNLGSEDKPVLDLASVPEDDRLEKKHLMFRLLPRIWSQDCGTRATPWSNFDTIVQAIKAKYEAKVALSKSILGEQPELFGSQINVEDIVASELRKTCSVPSKPVGVMDALTSLIPSIFKGEGRSQPSVLSAEVEFDDDAEIPVATEVEAPTAVDEVVQDESQDPPVSQCGSDSAYETPSDEAVPEYNDDPPEVSKDTVSVYSTYEDWLDESLMRICSHRDTAWLAVPDMVTERFEKRYCSSSSHYGKILAVGMVVGAMYALYRWFKPDDVEASDEVSFGAQSEPRRKVSHRQKGGSKWFRGNELVAEGNKGIETCRLDLGLLTAKAIPLKDNWLLTYAHCLFAGGRQIKPGSILKLNYHNETYSWPYNPVDTRLCLDPDTHEVIRDIAFIQVQDNKCPRFKNIENRFLTDAEYSQRGFDMMMQTDQGIRWSRAEPDVQVYSYGGKQYHLDDGFRYRASTQSGDCGSPCLVSSGPLVNKCAGIHVAGTLGKDDPIGLAVRVSYEMIVDATDSTVQETSYVAQGTLFDRLTEERPQNLISIEKASYDARVHVNVKTKLKPSCIAHHLPFDVKKEPAILSKDDPRSQGKDPLEEAILRLAQAPKVKIDPERLKRCGDATAARLEKGLDYSRTNGLRELTFEEALFGIPGALSGVCTATSPGSPYMYFVKKSGKTDLVWHDEGEGRFNPLFEEHVMEVYARIKAGEDYEKVFIGYLKDEVRSKSKIEKVNTRVTYANDVTVNVVLRMLFGAMIVAFNTSFPNHGYAIGINPGSYDMQKIYSRLRKYRARIVDGDFAEYDLRHQRQTMDESYRVLGILGSALQGRCLFEMVRRLDTECKALVAKWFIETECNNFSGGLFTTIVNCITAELYFRYSFDTRFPTKIFEEYIEWVILGDDHLIGVSPSIDWNPLLIREDMAQLGQVYTSSRKDQELTEDYHKFKEILFLGHHPRLVNGAWTGALRKDTLQESLLWTRNKNLTIFDECKQMVEYASQWDEPYYDWYKNAIDRALMRCGYHKLELPPWSMLRVNVANRTVDSGESYVYVAEGDEVTEEVVSTRGLTTTLPDTTVSASLHGSTPQSLGSLAASEVPATLALGVDSFVERAQYQWLNTDGLTADVAKIALPYQLLGMGDQNNLQNMPFQNFLYSAPDIEIKIQINGTPTQCGCLIAYFVPLSDVNLDWPNYTMMDHVKLDPSINPTAVLRIPFCYWRSYLDNQMSHDLPRTTGWFHLKVYSPLSAVTSPTDCGVTIYSKISTESRIPRAIAASASNTRPTYGFTTGTGAKAGNLYTSDTTFVAQGSTISTTSVANEYHVGTVAGSMPSEQVVSVGDASTDADATIVPLDNPPLVGGSIPTGLQFSSLSKANGVEPTVGMGLHPQELSRQPLMFRNPSDTSIGALLGRFGRLTNFTWDTTQADGQLLFYSHLNGIFAQPFPPASWTNTLSVPANIWLLNEFKYARYDVVYRFHAVRTKFHSGRLMASMAYGSKSEVPAKKQSLYNQIMDFNNDISVVEVVVPYNGTQEYIRTNESAHQWTNSSNLGVLHVTVANELRAASSVVATNVVVIVEIAFRNVRVAVPVPYNVVASSANATYEPSRIFIAQADDVNEAAATMVVTATKPTRMPNSFKIGEKFEYCVSDVHDLVKRYNWYPVDWIKKRPAFHYGETSPSRTTYRVMVTPASTLNDLYAGWSGTLKYRIYASSNEFCTVTHVPTDCANDESGFITMADGCALMENEPSRMARAPTFHPHLGREVLFPVGGMSYIDVSVPFYSEFNFLPTERITPSTDTNDPVPVHNGFLYINVPLDVRVDIFWAAGDDFRYHHFTGPTGMRRKLAGSGTTATFLDSGWSVLGMYGPKA